MNSPSVRLPRGNFWIDVQVIETYAKDYHNESNNPIQETHFITVDSSVNIAVLDVTFRHRFDIWLLEAYFLKVLEEAH